MKENIRENTMDTLDMDFFIGTYPLTNCYKYYFGCVLV